MPWKSFLVEDEYCVFLLDEDDNRTGDSLGCHETKEEADDQVAALNIAEDETRNLFGRFWKSFKALVSKERTIVDVDEWDGSASNYSTTEAYCNACLINLNEGDPEDWIQANCKLPVRREGDSSDTFVRQAVFAAAARFDQVDAPPEAKEAARTKLLSAYSEMDLEPPENLTRAISRQLLLQETLDKIRGEFNQQFGNDDWSNWLIDASDSFVIGDFSGTKFRIPYQIVDENIIFAPQDEWREVTVSYEERAISGQIMFDSLWQRMFELDAEIEGSDHFLVDVYFDENGTYALYVDRGKLYRYDIIVRDSNIALGERVEVMELHQPIEARTIIRQQEDGQFRWFSISGTAVLNRSGEIDSRDLFDSFVEYAEETGKYPIRMFYHHGGITENWEMDDTTRAFKTGQADFLARDGYCYITSGLYDDTPLARTEIEALRNNPDFWGESIRFWPTKAELTEISNGINIPVYKEGFNVEISTLPEREAAHLMTRTEVTMSLDGKARDAWLKLWIDAGQTEEDALRWLADHPEARNRAIEQEGMIRRDGEDQDGDDGDKPNEEDADTPQEFEIDDSVIDAVGQTVLESEAFTELSNRLGQIETQLAERSKADDNLVTAIERLTKRLDTLEKGEAVIQEQVADDTPAKFNGKPRIIYRPRQANAALEEDGIPYSEKAKANLPKGANY